MKWLLLLGAAVLLVLGAWFLLGRSSADLERETATFVIPTESKGKAAIIQAAQQFLKYDPKPANLHEGMELLRLVVEQLSDEDWPQVQAPTFRAWARLHRIPGTQAGLEPLAERLMDRFARFGSEEQLETMIRWSNDHEYWQPRIDAALARAASLEVPAVGSEQSRLLLLLGAAVRRRDYERAAGYVAGARWSEAVPDPVRAPVVRLEQALRIYYEVKAGKSRVLPAVHEWVKAPEDPLGSPVLVASGIELAKSGQHALDFGRLKEGMKETKGEAGAEKYWGDALQTYIGILPKEGAYTEAPTIEALVGSYSEQFKNPGFETAFWTRLADENKTKTLAEGIWRAECLKHALKATSDGPTRVRLLQRIAQEYQTYMPGKALENVEAMAALIKSPAEQPEVAAILEDARKFEGSLRARQAKLDQERVQVPLRRERDRLKGALTQARAGKGSPELIQSLERQIRELDKKLPE